MNRNDSEKKYIKTLDKIKETSKQNIPVKKGAGFEKRHVLWGLFVTLISFILSTGFLFASGAIFETALPVVSFIVVLVIILIGIIFDMVGIAVATADEIPFHSMASKKMRGARESLMLLRNASKVSTFCNDVIGDICSVVSGAAGASIVYRMFAGGQNSIVGTIAGAIIAAFTVGGKSLAKNIGIESGNYIVYRVGKILSYIHFFKRKSV